MQERALDEVNGCCELVFSRRFFTRGRGRLSRTGSDVLSCSVDQSNIIRPRLISIFMSQRVQAASHAKIELTDIRRACAIPSLPSAKWST